ncbi:putative MFS monocarboxylate transporter [Rhizodiscina lignyota]|uniref:MFS monocarboxylate transporter n=1 Tax=Rhizodiscina lignyota TaxID=1504668 RepID=A0A9P4I9Y5_9PEZI|nr:putative MFS monocarboxylate transporter [Rhizodiscina lignyota]
MTATPPTNIALRDVEKVPVAQHDRVDGGKEDDLEISQGEHLTRTSSIAHSVRGGLSAIISRVRTKDSIDPGPPPDGGFNAWSIACIAHLVNFNSWGFINSFGVFQTHYVEVMKIGGPSAVAWIGTVQVFVLFGMGTFTGRGLDGGFYRIQLIAGSVIYVVGLFMLSLCTKYWQIFLTQTLCLGIGYGLVFVPTLALVSTYFLEKRSTAMAVTVTGSSTGGLVFPAIAEKMLPTVGFAWTIRTMAFLQMALAIISCIVLKPRLPPRKSGPMVEWAAFKELPYTLYTIASFLYFWSVYVGFFFVGTFANNILHTNTATGINILIALNGVGTPSRLVPAYIAQKWTGPLNFMIPSAFVTGAILYSWIAVDSVTGLWIFAIFYGMAAAGLQALFPVALAALTTDAKKTGVRTGMCFSIVGVAVLTGPPIAGALVQQAGGKFLGLQLFAATSMTAAGVVMLCVRFAAVGWRRVTI